VQTVIDPELVRLLVATPVVALFATPLVAWLVSRWVTG
jgi:hypothetical protein